MKIELHQIPIHKIVDGYKNSEEEGVVGYGGKLNIRPKYQREFIYKPEQQIAVINSVMGGFPLNAMYWVKNSDGSFEILDGQQCTVSICNFLAGDFNVMNRGYQMYFENLTEEEKKKSEITHSRCIFAKAQTMKSWHGLKSSTLPARNLLLKNY